MELGRRTFLLGLESADMDERSRALAITRFEEACLWAERGLLMHTPQPDDEPAGEQPD